MQETEIEREKTSAYRLIRSIYAGRIFIKTAGLLVIISIFYKNTNYLFWAYIIVITVLWPHIAFLVSKYSKDTKKSVVRNLVIDSFVWGTVLNIYSLSLLPSVAIMVGLSATNILFGGYQFLLKGGLISLLGYLICGLFIGFEFSFEATMLTTIVSATAIFLNGIFISQLGYNSIMAQRKLKREMKAQKNQIEGLAGKLAKYLSPQVYGSIFSGDKEVKIETSRKKLSIFFSDIKDFTSITDSMESEGLTSLLNNYFDEMTKIALKYGGTIDKFIGDAIMIFFGDPKSKGEKEDALSCVLMAIEMRDKMNTLQKRWEEIGISRPLKIRMGINTGFCTVGNFGSEDRMDYTIIGNQVNLASRMESNAGADQILISQETYALVKHKIACQRKEEIIVKGISYPIETYQVINSHDILKTNGNKINEDHQGFSLSVDLNETDRKQAALWLRAALDKVESV